MRKFGLNDCVCGFLQPCRRAHSFKFLEDQEECRTRTEAAFFEDAVYAVSGCLEVQEKAFGFVYTHPVYEVEEVHVEISVDGS